MSCPAIRARSRWGSTVWPKPTMPGKRILARPHPGEQVVPDLFLDAAVRVAAGAQLSEGRGGWVAGAGMVAVLLHHSTVCRDRRSLPSAPFRLGTSGPGMGGTLLSRGNNTRHGELRRRGRGPRADPRCDLGHARAPLPGAVRDGGRPGVPEVREPPADRLVQGARGLLRIARLSDAERARGVVAASAGNHAQGVAFAAGRLGCAATVVMPARRAAAQGAGDAGLRRGRHPARHARGGRARRGPGLRRADRRGVHPPLRPSGHRGGPGHPRPRDHRAVPAGAHGGGAGRRRGLGGRRRGRGQGPRPGDPGRRRAGRGGGARIPDSLAAGPPMRCRPAPPWRTASRSAARGHPVRHPVRGTPAGW